MLASLFGPTCPTVSVSLPSMMWARATPASHLKSTTHLLKVRASVLQPQIFILKVNPKRHYTELLFQSQLRTITLKMLGVSPQTQTLWSSPGRYICYLNVQLFEAASNTFLKRVCALLSAVPVTAGNGQT